MVRILSDYAAHMQISPCCRTLLMAQKSASARWSKVLKGDSIMNQAELTAAVAERAGLTKADAGKAVEALVGTITEALTRGDEIRISGFGSFGISERSERQGRNPQTGEAITIAASKAAKFTAAKAVKDALNGG
jgi:DNA-binding protein HU-beta